MDQYGLSFNDASQLTSERSLADYYEKAAEVSGNPRSASNWIRSELLRELESAGLLAGFACARNLGAGAASRRWKINASKERRAVEMFSQ